MMFSDFVIAMVLIPIAVTTPGLTIAFLMDNGLPVQESWSFWGVIGMLSFFSIGALIWKKSQTRRIYIIIR